VTINSKISNRSFVISMAVLVLTLILTVALSARGKPVVVSTNLENLPMEINGMQGVNDTFSELVYQALNADKHVYRHYQSSDGKKVDFYIGYYGTAKGGRTAHNPIGCLPGQGWGLLESREIILKPRYYPDGVPVNYLLSSKGDTVITTIHWYQSAGTKVISNGIRHNIQRFMGMVLRNRNDGAFVRVTVVSDKEDAEAAMKLAKAFSLRILNLLPGYWPEEK
jgi:EpsI family protein